MVIEWKDCGQWTRLQEEFAWNPITNFLGKLYLLTFDALGSLGYSRTVISCGRNFSISCQIVSLFFYRLVDYNPRVDKNQYILTCFFVASSGFGSSALPWKFFNFGEGRVGVDEHFSSMQKTFYKLSRNGLHSLEH